MITRTNRVAIAIEILKKDLEKQVKSGGPEYLRVREWSRSKDWVKIFSNQKKFQFKPENVIVSLERAIPASILSSLKRNRALNAQNGITLTHSDFVRLETVSKMKSAKEAKVG